jgi:acetoacetyl-CoA synthetase
MNRDTFITPKENNAEVREGDLLWTPSPDFAAAAQVTRFIAWLKEVRGLSFADYELLWQWSVSDLEGFWRAIWDYFDVMSDTAPSRMVAGAGMFGARWFEGSRTNYAEHLLRYEVVAKPDEAAFFHTTEIRTFGETRWLELGNQVRTLATWLRTMGIKPGDHIVSYMPNVPETAVAMMATVAIGAVWSSAAPEFGAKMVTERFGQVAPRLAFVADGYSFNGRLFDRRTEITEIAGALPNLMAIVWLPYLGLDRDIAIELPIFNFVDILSGPPVTRGEFRYERVAADHPLWVLFSSGTTGVPKAIVHSHAGMIAEHLKLMTLNFNLRPGKRMFFYTTTGWMMWNLVLAALIAGASPILYDGSPVYGGIDALWSLAAQSRATFFGLSPTLVQSMKTAGIRPSELFDLSSLESIMLGGSPSTPEIFAWIYENVRRDLWLTSQSGGTEICSGLAVSIPTRPVYAGEIQCRGLGIDVHVWSDAGEEVIDEVGELVVTSPMPSAPLRFYGDVDGSRYHESYYATFPDVWRHGDLAKVNLRGGVYIYGRSDSTLNRFGVRIGTAEIYRVVEQVPGVTDSLVICCETPDGGFYMPMFVTLDSGVELDETMLAAISARLRTEASPRHVPDEIHSVPGIPYTLTGKKMEVPIRKLVMGQAVESVVSRDAMANPPLLDWYISFAARPDVAARRTAR